MSGLGHMFTHPVGTILHPVRSTKRLLGLGGIPDAPPAAPTIDDANMGSQQMQDVMRKRRGVYANIYAGGAAAPPTVGSKTLLGQ